MPNVHAVVAKCYGNHIETAVDITQVLILNIGHGHSADLRLLLLADPVFGLSEAPPPFCLHFDEHPQIFLFNNIYQ